MIDKKKIFNLLLQFLIGINFIIYLDGSENSDLKVYLNRFDSIGGVYALLAMNAVIFSAYKIFFTSHISKSITLLLLSWFYPYGVYFFWSNLIIPGFLISVIYLATQYSRLLTFSAIIFGFSVHKAFMLTLLFSLAPYLIFKKMGFLWLFLYMIFSALFLVFIFDAGIVGYIYSAFDVDYDFLKSFFDDGFRSNELIMVKLIIIGVFSCLLQFYFQKNYRPFFAYFSINLYLTFVLILMFVLHIEIPLVERVFYFNLLISTLVFFKFLDQLRLAYVRNKYCNKYT